MTAPSVGLIIISKLFSSIITLVFILPSLVLNQNTGDNTILNTRSGLPSNMFHPLNVTDPIDPLVVPLLNSRYEKIYQPFVHKLDEETGVTFDYLSPGGDEPVPDQLT
jgi:hypothetical protein